MKAGNVAEFLFAGAATMSALFLWLGRPGLMVMIGLPLLLAGCLASMADPGAPFRTMDPPPRKPKAGPGQSGMRHPVPQPRQRTRSQGEGNDATTGSR